MNMHQYALGTDAVAIQRFATWSSYSHARLRRIFSEQEISYCIANPRKTAERFAVRFAAREAFFKALHSLIPTIKIPLLTIAKNVAIPHTHNGAPHLIVDWHALNIDIIHGLGMSLSLTHTQDTAWATVLLWVNER